MRTCTKCKQEKKDRLFGKNKRVKSGLTALCRECINSYRKDKYDPEKESTRKKKNKNANPERYKEIDRRNHLRYRRKHRERLRKKWREDKKGKFQKYNKEKAVAAVIKWRNANRKKVRCSDRARSAEKRGELVPPENCEICDVEGKLQKHHHNYNKPMDVVWCCTSCHGKLDRIRREEEEEKKIRRKTNATK